MSKITEDLDFIYKVKGFVLEWQIQRGTFPNSRGREPGSSDLAHVFGRLNPKYFKSFTSEPSHLISGPTTHVEYFGRKGEGRNLAVEVNFDQRSTIAEG